MKNVPLYLLTALLAVVVVGQYREATTDAHNSKIAYVYTVCNNSRQELDSEAEQACGDAQDATNTEFLCEANNMLPTTHCWLEVK